jgi:hypothetical protein
MIRPCGYLSSDSTVEFGTGWATPAPRIPELTTGQDIPTDTTAPQLAFDHCDSTHIDIVFDEWMKTDNRCRRELPINGGTITITSAAIDRLALTDYDYKRVRLTLAARLRWSPGQPTPDDQQSAGQGRQRTGGGPRGTSLYPGGILDGV